MKTLHTPILLLAVVILIGCSNPSQDIQPDATIGLRDSESRPTDKPFKASLGVFIPILNGVCDDGSDRYIGSFRGNATYLGLVGSDFEICDSDPTNIEMKFFNPSSATQTAVLDTINMILNFSFDVGNDDAQIPLFTITGGTGRFANATGEGIVMASQIDRYRGLRDSLALKFNGRISF